MYTTAGKLADLKRRYHEAVTASGEAAIEKQHARGKMTARERIDQLLDHGSFVELDEFVRHRTHAFGMDAKRPYGDSVVTGTGTINGRQVAVYSQDFTIFGGSLGEVAGEKIIKVMELAIKTGVPIIGILDSGGARIQEGVVALGKYGEIFRLNTRASGVIPQISLIMGPAAGGAVYSPALTDFVIMVDKTSHMFVTGPDVIKTVTGEEVGFEELGGALTHNKVSGVAHYLASDEDDALDYARTLLGFLPDNNLAELPEFPRTVDLEMTARDHELDTIIPDSPNQPYDMKTIIERIVDDGEFLETQPLFAPNIIVGFARVEGRSVGIVANQPNAMAGTLNIEAGEKASRFVRFCDAFSIPILTLVDVPGYLPGTEQEWTGVIRRGRSCCTRTPRRPCRSSPSSRARRTAARTSSWDPSSWARHQPRVADGRDRGDGRPGRRQHPLPRRDQGRRAGRRGRRGSPHPAGERVHVQRREPVPRGGARRARQRHPAGGHARVGRQGPAGAAHQAREPAAQEAREHPAVSDAHGSADAALGGFRVLGGSPTEEELAAATAVIAALAAQPAAEQPVRRAPDAWQRSQRSVRGTLVPGPGRWRGFSG
ncbi:putative propionyl-CoA carboxylase beta chain 5 [Clavibacter michiganensis subsp. michiganensis]|uniref:Putative propionyl-CoA carboxylase beta chain 5 n=2 Tax=Clavibacter michiganensis TaxID=28447 RepID=A0A251XD80_CLAMM|nr:putative propionyl-CoA carboxylase beta chain 5 [Clavibacter michiganensis subsp. michiganensis]OUD99999.1 putative propionyl-CoA carboxylase beta chain 5 [Clavibacter michiganensis subsp. michiganensis]